MNRRTSVLSVVDDKVGVLEIHFEKTKAVSIDRLKFDGALVRSGNGGEEIAVLVVQNVPRDVRYPVLIENPLFSILRREFDPIPERKHLRDCGEFHDGNVVRTLPDVGLHGRELNLHSIFLELWFVITASERPSLTRLVVQAQRERTYATRAEC